MFCYRRWFSVYFETEIDRTTLGQAGQQRGSCEGEPHRKWSEIDDGVGVKALIKLANWWSENVWHVGRNGVNAGKGMKLAKTITT